MIYSNLPSLDNCNIAVIGMGYVGLPLALEFAKNKSYKGRILSRRVIGFDIKKNRIDDLNKGLDKTNEVSPEEMSSISNLEFTSDENSLCEADVFIVTVPTPIDKNNKPDLLFIEKASQTIGKCIKKRKNELNDKGYSNPIVIYESTVYPGATEEFCVPIIEQFSGLKYNQKDSKPCFFCGYSPERINPGDKEHRLNMIVKVTSGSNSDVSEWIKEFYSSIIQAGIFSASSIKVAEAAKVIENTQRDINIALVNELAIIFKLMNIDTLDVIEAANTKWNFVPFKPGLVGGHCIGIDPYYLTYKANDLGYKSEVVLAGRKINEGMAYWIANQIVLEMNLRNIPLKGAHVLIMGFTFKEDCPDIRNSKINDLLNILRNFSINCVIFDPLVDKKEAKETYSVDITNDLPKNINFDAIILAVAHAEFRRYEEKTFDSLCKSCLIFDLKGILPKSMNAIRF